ncbi:major capsid family protein [Providencia rettgeri]
MQPTLQQFLQVTQSRGIHLPSTLKYLAMDADVQPTMSANGGIPAIVSTFIDPTIVSTLFADNRAVQIIGSEEKKGSWAQDSFMIQRVEGTGDTVAYDDYSDQGGIQITSEWEGRDVYRYQTMVTYGELEQERYDLAMLPYVAKKQEEAIRILDQDANKFYFYGVDGLRNYGLLNDPALPAPIIPLSSNGKVSWKDKEVIDIYNDVLALYEQLVSQTNGIVGDGVNMDSNLVLALSNKSSVYVKKSNEIFGNSVEKMLKDSFPNMTIETAPQYSTDSGELVQMFVKEARGQKACYAAYSEKLRTHPLIPNSSSYKQKYSATTYGTVITMPVFFVQMLGI